MNSSASVMADTGRISCIFRSLMGHDDVVQFNKTDGMKLLIRDIQSLGVHRNTLLIISGIVVLAPLVCNGVVLVTFFKLKCLRRIHDKLAANLAMVNIITTLGIPFYMSNTTFPMTVWMNKYVCLSHYIVFLGGILTSLFILLGLACERYICIVYPLKYRRLRNTHLVVWVLLSYSLGFGFYVVPLFGWNNWSKHNLCSEDIFPRAAKLLYEVLILSILLVNAFFHLYVFRIAVTQSQKISLLVRHVRNTHSSKVFRSKAFTTVFILAVCSILSWMPQLIVYCILRYNDNRIDVFDAEIIVEISYIPVLINTTLSPMIFAYRNRHFRDAVKSTIHCKRHFCNS